MNLIIPNEDTYLLLVDKNLTKDIFISNSNVREGTYAFNLVERIYDMLFSEIINLKEEYNKYYCDEYSSFPIFLSKYYNLDEKCIDYILSQDEKDIFIGSTSLIIDNINGLIYYTEGENHDEIMDFINLLMEVPQNED